MTEKRTNTASPRNTSSQRSGSSRRGSKSASRARQNQRKKDNAWLLAGTLVALGLLAAVLIVKRGENKEPKPDKETTLSENQEGETEETLSDEIVYGDYVLDLTGIKGFSDDAKVSVRGKSRAEIYAEAADFYTWDMKITNGKADVGNVVKPTVDADATTEAATMGDAENPDSAQDETEGVAAFTEITVASAIPVPDFVNSAIKASVEDIFADDISTKGAKLSEKKAKEKETEAETKKKGKKNKETEESTTGAETTSEESESIVFKTELGDLSEAIDEIATYAEDMWYQEAKGEGIGSFDKATEKFIMEGAEDGARVKKDELVEAITKAVNEGDFKKTIEAPMEKISSANAAKNGDYKIIASFTTKTTNNSVRNKNVRLACEALNGTIVRSGEEFSYNSAVGERTEERGFGAAAAYVNGEVVQEIGGGVCQVSSTLYNAVLKAGLKTTKRTSHTFEPSYVTPGEDATVSWGGPDYRFANVPAHADISYDQSYAIGILAHYSDQTVTVEIYGRPVLKPGYSLSLSSEKIAEKEIVRILIPPEDTEKEPTTGSKGSTWKTYLIIKKDGTELSKVEDHNTYYSGHTEYYRETEATSETESSAEEPTTEPYTGPIGPGMPSDAYEQYINGGGQNSPGEAESTSPAISPNPNGPGGGNTTPGQGDSGNNVVSPGGQDAPVVVDAPGGQNTDEGIPVAGPGQSANGNMTGLTDGPGGGPGSVGP